MVAPGLMPLGAAQVAAGPPLTNLTLHLRADVNTNLFKTYPTAGGNPVDGDNVQSWRSELDSKLMIYIGGQPLKGPTYKTVTPGLPLPCCNFKSPSDDGGYIENLYADSWDISLLHTVSAKTLLVAFRVAGNTADDGTAYNNNPLIADQIQYWGLFYRNNSGTHQLIGYNWHGGNQTVVVPYSLNTNYVATYRHDGTNIYLGLNNAAESSTPSGTTDSLANNLRMGGAGATYNINIGEVLMYNIALTGADLAAAKTYMVNKWV